jgi:hypothetical protein
MRKITQFTAVAVVALGALLHAAPAEAQAPRTFVSGQGSDSNPCSTVQTPCRHFAAALAQTAPGGEITVLDSAGYGEFTIAQSVTITAIGVEAGITSTSGASAITIHATSAATITLRGLTLEGGGVGANGINLTSTAGGTLNIIDCVVKDFTESGIAIQPAVSGTSQTEYVVIANTFALNNTQNGINLATQTTASAVSASIYQTTATSNGTGIALSSNEGFISASISSSHADMNNNLGINQTSEGDLVIKSSTVQQNAINDIINTDGFLFMCNNNTIGGLNTSVVAYTDGTNNIEALSGAGSLTKLAPR